MTASPERVEVVAEDDFGRDRIVGDLYLQRGGGGESATFRYAADWLEQAGGYAIEPALPLSSAPARTPLGRRLFGAFSDSAPDRWGCELAKRAERRRAAAAGTTRRALGEADFLLSVRDLLRQGALRLRDPRTGEFLAAGSEGIPRLVELPRLLRASANLEADADSDEDLRLLLLAGSSLGGARPKANVVGADGALRIAKFPRVHADVWNVVAWEEVALRLARASRIRVSDSSLHRVGALDVLMVDRFDRAGERRVGYVSAMTMLEATDGDRRSYLEIVEVLETSSPHATRDIQELWRRIAFSILISNTDDHLRNHGFLRTSRGWALAPAFDVNPDPDGPKVLSTAIDLDLREARIDVLMDVAPYFRFRTSGDAVAVLREVVHGTSRWRSVAAACGVGGQSERLADAFEHPQRAAARALVAR